MVLSKANWSERDVRLTFRLGEIPLYAATFSLWVSDAHFTELTGGTNDLKGSWQELPATAQGMLVRSHPIDEYLPRIRRLEDTIRYVPAQYERYYVDLQGTFEDYLTKFSSKSRSTLQRKVRKFTEFSGGQLCWQEYSDAKGMEEFCRLAREVSAKTYQERLLDAGLPSGEEFVQQACNAADNGSAKGYILFHESRPIAYIYCPITEGILGYQYVGYDPEYRQWSPGTVLQYCVLEKLFAEGTFRMFDFTEGEGLHKEFFATGSTRCADIYFFRCSMRNYFILSAHAALDSLSDGMVRILDRLGLKARIKRLLRSSPDISLKKNRQDAKVAKIKKL